MEKENVIKSKIPIPLDPLPPITEEVLKRSLSLKIKRCPLKTLYQESVNVDRGTISKKLGKAVRRSNSATNKIDTKHVTIRQKSEELDWNLKVFKDDASENHLSDKDSKSGKIATKRPNSKAECKNDINTTTANKECCVGEHSKTSTPNLKSLLEPSRVRNIKRSLKRPHSRELQGISPSASVDKRDEKHRRKLDFTDTSRCEKKCQPTDCWFNSYATSVSQDYGQNIFINLLKSEKIIQHAPKITNDTRTCIMNWLVKINGSGGNPAAVQTAAWFFDTTLAHYHVSLNKLQVLAAACYWIAVKMLGNLVSAKTLVKTSADAFSVKLLVSAEAAVIKKLNFPVQPIVAQDFIAYVSWDCDKCKFFEIETTASLLYMAGLVVDMNLSLHYPSVLAIAAIKNALHLLKKKELMTQLESNLVYKEADKKESNFDRVCWSQRQALRKMLSPRYECKALLDYEQNNFLIKKIIDSLQLLSRRDKALEF